MCTVILAAMKTRFLFFLTASVVGMVPATPQTGIAVPQMTACDGHVQNYLNTYGIPGAAIALSRNGKLVYDRAFGHADLSGTEPVQPYHRFRLASVSKPITGVAVMAAVQQGLISLDDRPFGPEGLLSEHPYLGQVTYADERLHDITLRQLLQHTAGWDRDINCFPSPTSPYPWFFGGCEPIVAPLHVTAQFGAANPADKHMMVRFLMEKGLAHDPGTTYAYSNIGYLVAGICLEQVTGMSYDEYVRQLFAPVGVCDLALGMNLLEDKLEREVEYHGEGYLTLDLYGSGQLVPWEYGGFSVEAMDAHGGWVCSARDLVKMVAVVDGFVTVPDILSPASVQTMVTPSAADPNYALGWQVNGANNWWHTGAVDGTATMVVRSSGGYIWAILLNKRITTGQANAFWGALDALGWNCISSTASWPTHDLMAMPKVSASNVQAQSQGNGTVHIQFTPGDGDGRLVVMRPVNAPQRFPLDGQDYTADATYSGGSDLGDDNHVVNAGPAAEVTVTGVPAGAYTVHEYEYTRNTTTGQNTLFRLCDRDDVQVDMPVGVEELAGQGALRAWTVGDVLHWSTPDAPPSAMLQVMDLAGRELHAPVSVRRSTSLSLDVAAGVYLVRLVDQGRTIAVTRVFAAGR